MAFIHPPGWICQVHWIRLTWLCLIQALARSVKWLLRKRLWKKSPASKRCGVFFVMAMAEVVWGCRENGIDSEREQLYGFTNVWAIVYGQGVERCVSFVSNPEISNNVYNLHILCICIYIYIYTSVYTIVIIPYFLMSCLSMARSLFCQLGSDCTFCYDFCVTQLGLLYHTHKLVTGSHRNLCFAIPPTDQEMYARVYYYNYYNIKYIAYL